MVIGMVSGAVKFFFLFLDFFLLIYPLQYTSALPPMLFLLTHLSTSLPFIFFSSTCIFLYSSFFLLSFFFYSFCFPFLPSHEFFFFFLFFSSLSLSLSSVQNLFRIVSDLFYSPIYNYFFPQPFRCVVCLFPFHSLFFFSCFFIFIFSIFQ